MGLFKSQSKILAFLLLSFIISDMHISWHGEFTIKIQSEDKVLLIDPLGPETGLSPLRTTANLIALTNPANKAMSYTKTTDDDTVILDTPGEYDVKGFSLHALGWRADDGSERSLQRWSIEDVTLLHVGALNRELTADELQYIEKTDIHVLFVPVGGGEALSAQQAMNLITTIEPRMVIPIHYKLPDLKEELEDVAHFAKEIGIDATQREKKIIIKANKLPSEDMVTVLLAP